MIRPRGGPQTTGRRRYRIRILYRYYRHILRRKGESGDRTAPILNSITLSTDVTNDRHMQNYSGRIYLLSFAAQAVTVDGTYTEGPEAQLGDQTGVRAEWKMDVRFDGSGLLEWTWYERGDGRAGRIGPDE